MDFSLHLRCVLAAKDTAIIKGEGRGEVFNKKAELKETTKLLRHDYLKHFKFWWKVIVQTLHMGTNMKIIFIYSTATY